MKSRKCYATQVGDGHNVARYEKGDYLKVMFEGTGEMPGEWMWVKVDACDDARRLVFCTLDNDPIATEGLQRGQQLAVSFDKVAEHRKPWEFAVN